MTLEGGNGSGDGGQQNFPIRWRRISNSDIMTLLAARIPNSDSVLLVEIKNHAQICMMWNDKFLVRVWVYTQKFRSCSYQNECYAMYVWAKPLAVKSPQQYTHTLAERENKSDTTINNINE